MILKAFRKVDKGSALHQALSGQEDRDHGGRHKSKSDRSGVEINGAENG